MSQTEQSFARKALWITVEKYLRMARARAGAGVRGGFIQNRQLPESAPGVARRVAPRAEYSRSGARGGRRSGTLDGIFHNWGRCTKTATTPGGPKTPATVAFSRSSQDLPLMCSDIGKESSAARSEHYFGTFSTRSQPPAAVGLTRALQIFPKSGPTPNPEHSAHGARLGRTSDPKSGISRPRFQDGLHCWQ